MGFSDWKEIALGVTAAAGATALIYYLFKEEPKGKAQEREQSKPATGKKITKDELLVILKTISKSQEQMKSIMQDLMKDVAAQKPTFSQMYDMVKKKTPEDPLEKAGISMQEFDSMLDQNQDNPEVRAAIMALMGNDAGAAQVEASAKVQALTLSKIREIHAFMLDELRSLIPQTSQVNNADGKTIAIAAQALVGAKVQSKFGLAADEFETALRHHHEALSKDEEFAHLAMQVQNIMSTLMTGTGM